MDPLSQAAVGATFAGALSKSETIRRSLAVGGLAAMSADLDILIRSNEDMLLSLEYHRHFTHSLLFIPIGALLSSLILSLFFRCSFKTLYRPAFWGYATAGLLDALTSYGTHLFWPFTNERTAWNFISIIDPIYTLTILAFLIWTFKTQSQKPLRIVIVFILLWHSFGAVQNRRALSVLEDIAAKEEIPVERFWVQPSLGNLIVWRGLIESKDQVELIAIRTGFDLSVFRGGRYQKYKLEDDTQVPAGSRLAQDIQRFSFFSKHFLAYDPSNPKLITDTRYSPLPWTLGPLWALEKKAPDQHPPIRYFRDFGDRGLEELWLAIKGAGVFAKTSKH